MELVKEQMLTATDTEFTMQQAKPLHTKDLMTLLVNTAQWFKANGSTQWSGLLEGIDTHRTEEAIERGDVFVATNGDAISRAECLG